MLLREYNSKKIFVFGEVQKPGTFPYEEDMSIIQAITMAGGFTKVASKNDIAVTRQVEGKETKIRVPVADIGSGTGEELPAPAGGHRLRAGEHLLGISPMPVPSVASATAPARRRARS